MTQTLPGSETSVEPSGNPQAAPSTPSATAPSEPSAPRAPSAATANFVQKPKKLSFFIVEPSALIYSFAFGIYFGAFTPGLYSKICWQEFHMNSSVDCNNLRATKEAEFEVQKVTVWKSLIFHVGHFLPGKNFILFF